ncbi:MAG: hypothetical protein HY012_02565 [Acidobacteria bacterium]|nr:hypothetical protein [Acidobacteriota bacterium]
MNRKTWTVKLLTCAAVVLAASLTLPSLALDEPPIIPLDQIKPGMKGVMYTILAGDKIESIELEVLGILPNTLGPKQDIILVVLRGGLADFNGVVAGMSGSPVYIEGKLAGALSLRFGQFSKEAIAGVTPIQNMYDADPPASGVVRADAVPPPAAGGPNESAAATQIAVPAEMARRVGAGDGGYLTKIDTPLVFSGFHPEVIQRFGPQFAAYGMVATQGGTAPASADDAQIKGGDMVSMVLVKGDLSLQASCTVTAVVGDRVFVCGHPLFSYGNVSMPLARGRVDGLQRGHDVPAFRGDRHRGPQPREPGKYVRADGPGGAGRDVDRAERAKYFYAHLHESLRARQNRKSGVAGGQYSGAALGDHRKRVE